MQRNLHQQELQRMHLNVYTVIVHVLYTADDRTKRWNIYYYITGILYQDISGVVGGGGRPPLNKFRGYCSHSNFKMSWHFQYDILQTKLLDNHDCSY